MIIIEFLEDTGLRGLVWSYGTHLLILTGNFPTSDTRNRSGSLKKVRITTSSFGPSWYEF